ncbi:MAG: FkbM family methyltransferase [Holosporaceae bacterium]|jgi:FkbM family methyltransferase|nr:FkbM family methyltransferase [Holosporaceae bacterium]
MNDSYFNEKQETGFFNRNKVVSFAIIISCMLFICIFFMEKSRSVLNMVPLLRGEVHLDGGFIITTIKNKYPIIIKKNDPFIGKQLRFSGSIKSIFAAVADSLCRPNDVVVEVGAHFGYNALSLGDRLRGGGKYYAYEPNPFVISCLRKSIVLNDLEQVIFPKSIAISGKEGTCHIEDCVALASSVQDDDEPISPNQAQDHKFIDVNCNTLDKELSDEIQPITLLLIDIPGFEFSIIKGARDIMKRSPDIKLVVAIDMDESSKTLDPQKELEELAENGYKFYIAETPKTYTSAKISEILAKKKMVLLIAKCDP